MSLHIRLTILLVLLFCTAKAQVFSLSGSVTDAGNGSAIPGATVVLTAEKNNNGPLGATSGNDGRFLLTNIPAGTYRMTVSSIGYEKYTAALLLTGNKTLPAIRMKGNARELKNVTIAGRQVRAQQNGDTAQFNADAYKTHPDATAEDLIKKMPGVTSDNNGVKVNGEDVKKVLVDGKPFFGDDPAASLKNLPAEIIDRVQVFDNMSDQSKFTGFNDGNSQKTINFITRNGKNNGQFGKIYAGYGPDDRYQLGGTLNMFDGARRISILALSNNINQQNFSIADVMSVMSNTGNLGGGGPGGGGPPVTRVDNSGNAGRSNSSFGGGPGGLLTPTQSGITATNAVGLNYSDEWGKKIKISGSYFFNSTDNKNTSDLERDYFNSNGLTYAEHNESRTKNTNHRFNLRFEYTIDTANSLIVTPQFSYQGNNYTTGLQATSRIGDGIVAGTTVTDQKADNKGYSFTNNILYQHKFAKKGRTVSLNVNTKLSNRTGNGSYYSSSLYEGDTTKAILDQQYDLHTHNQTVGATLTYTEPAGKKGQLLASYSPSFTGSSSDKSTNDRDTVTGQYDRFNSSLSNKYTSTYNTHQGGLSYRYNSGRLNLMASANLQYAQLTGGQEYPGTFSVSKNFTSILPAAMLNYKFSNTRNLNIMYRTANNAPSVSQLQNVPDVSNPLQVSTGNPALVQTSEHSVMMRYGNTNIKTSRNFFLFANGSYINDYIGSATYIPLHDTVVDGYALGRGSQLTRPVNVDGYYTGRAFMVYSLPVRQIQSNVNLNAGATYTHTPSLINDAKNIANSMALNGGVYIGSNISSQLDFSLSYNGSYNIVKNTLQASSDNTYYNHTANFKVNWIFLKGFVLNTDITHTLYHGLSSDYDQSFYLWNASLGYKFLKDRSLEAKVSVYDILGQNRSISRTVSETYTQDTRTQVLQRYGMLTLTYTLRNFKNGTAPENKMMVMPGMPAPGKDGGPPPGLPPPVN